MTATALPFIGLLLSCFGGDIVDTGYAGEPSSECTRYCNAMLALCEDIYIGEGECHRTCDDWSDDGREGIREGDSVQCRTTYAELGQCVSAEDDSGECIEDSGNNGGDGSDSGV
ncbi:MAG: hypothetical protein GY913_23260 [Proteobacteria bacterium]|nr:hypothetical protein [Pseudomonadota bacterium]MCP4919831.1 hypothetical protein [Pseudomonadota bacterium]